MTEYRACYPDEGVMSDLCLRKATESHASDLWHRPCLLHLLRTQLKAVELSSWLLTWTVWPWDSVSCGQDHLHSLSQLSWWESNLKLHSLGDPGSLTTTQQLPNPNSIWNLPFFIAEIFIVKIPHLIQAEIQIIFLEEAYFYKALKELWVQILNRCYIFL